MIITCNEINYDKIIDNYRSYLAPDTERTTLFMAH